MHQTGCLRYKLIPFWIVHFTPESLYTLAGIISSHIKTIAFSAEPASQKFVFDIAEEAGNRISDIYYGSVLQDRSIIYVADPVPGLLRYIKDEFLRCWFSTKSDGFDVGTDYSGQCVQRFRRKVYNPKRD